jgi:amino acid adenylation domain-containing protein
MASAEELLSRLQSSNVTVWADGDALRYRAPKGTMTPEIAAELKSRKTDLIALLRDRDLPVLEPIPNQDHYELSHAQRRLWVLSQIPEASIAYNIPLHQLFRGSLHRACIDAAFDLLVQRHEVLRTTFVPIDGEPRQIIRPRMEFEVGFRDFTGHPQAELLARELGRQESRRQFDLEKGPLFRVTLAKLGEQLHMLCFTIHHIVADGTSLAVLQREFVHFYDAIRKKASSTLPPLRLQYRDYAAWQNRYLNSAASRINREYWHEKLSGRIPVLNLPLDCPRPPVLTSNGREVSFTIDRSRLDALLALSRRESVSLFMTLLATVKVLLHRYTGQEDILVGSPIAGRVEAELEEQVGFYLNVLALRNQVRSDMPFKTLLHQVRRTATEAYDHQLYPFDRLVDELQVERDLSRSPLYDVLVVLQNQDDQSMAVDDCEVLPCFEHPETSKVDLTFTFKEIPLGLLISIEYNTDLFSESRIKRMGSHLSQLLDSIVAKPNETVGRLQILPSWERREILGALDNTADACAGGKSVIDLFEEQVRRTPESVAIEFSGATLTFRELNWKSNQLARYLKVHGVGPETPVGLYIERSHDLLIGLLGIMKAGGFYVPLDPGHPKERLEFMVAHADLPLILTQQRLVDEAPGSSAELLCLDTDWPAISRHGGEIGVCEVHQENLAYAIYTSGSTGRPKGVQISHGSLANLLASTRQVLRLSAGDVFLAVTTISFDISGLELYLPLVTGARVVIVPTETASDGFALATAIRQSGATVMQGTPATWRLLLNSGWSGAANLKVLCGGEALTRDLAEALLERSAAVWNLYGPTETTIWSAAHPVPRNASDMDAPEVPLGRPLDNTQFYILDSSLEPLPVGVPGELYIGGDGLARGYTRQADDTACRFVPNPFHEGERLYRTGDLACYDFNRELRFLGRLDHQIKLRGFRIELGEIEATLAVMLP